MNNQQNHISNDRVAPTAQLLGRLAPARAAVQFGLLRIRPKITSVFQANRGLSPCGFLLAGLGASPGWFSKSPNPWSIALRLDVDLKGRDPTARSEGPVLANGKSRVQA